jgi:hypothetical protein
VFGKLRTALCVSLVGAAGALGVAALTAGSAGAAVTYYVAPAAAGGSDTNDCTSPTVTVAPIGPCLTIDHAASLAVAGDSISVAPGTYTETLATAVPVAVTLSGGGATTISGLQATDGISASGGGAVTLSGDTISGAPTAVSDTNANALTLTGDTINNYSVAGVNAAGTVTSTSTITGGAGADGIVMAGGSISGGSITGNGTGVVSTGAITVAAGTITGNTTGVSNGGTFSGTISGNGTAILNNGAVRAGSSVSGATTGINNANGTVTGSTIANNTGTGVSGGTVTGSEITGNGTGIANTANAQQNRIVGNTTGVNGGTATDDWWGCDSGPGGTGCDTATGGATTSPYLVLKVNANPANIDITPASAATTLPTTSSITETMSPSDGSSGSVSSFPEISVLLSTDTGCLVSQSPCYASNYSVPLVGGNSEFPVSLSSQAAGTADVTAKDGVNGTPTPATSVTITNPNAPAPSSSTSGSSGGGDTGNNSNYVSPYGSVGSKNPQTVYVPVSQPPPTTSSAASSTPAADRATVATANGKALTKGPVVATKAGIITLVLENPSRTNQLVEVFFTVKVNNKLKVLASKGVKFQGVKSLTLHLRVSRFARSLLKIHGNRLRVTYTVDIDNAVTARNLMLKIVPANAGKNAKKANTKNAKNAKKLKKAKQHKQHKKSKAAKRG